MKKCFAAVALLLVAFQPGMPVSPANGTTR